MESKYVNARQNEKHAYHTFDPHHVHCRRRALDPDPAAAPDPAAHMSTLTFRHHHNSNCWKTNGCECKTNKLQAT